MAGLKILFCQILKIYGSRKVVECECVELQ